MILMVSVKRSHNLWKIGTFSIEMSYEESGLGLLMNYLTNCDLLCTKLTPLSPRLAATMAELPTFNYIFLCPFNQFKSICFFPPPYTPNLPILSQPTSCRERSDISQTPYPDLPGASTAPAPSQYIPHRHFVQSIAGTRVLAS